MRLAAVAAAAATVLAIAACGSSTTGASSGSQGTISVVASINQWGSVARDLGGSSVNVTSIMSNTKVEAHDYEPTSQDVMQFTKARVVVVNGAGYDSWASKAAQSTSATLVDAAQTAGKKSGDNPHVWFSASVRNDAADAITRAYTKADPSHKAEYTQLNKKWHAREQALERKIAEACSRTENVRYAATESVAWYLAHDLKMSDATPRGYAQASANESEPTPGDITAFQKALAAGTIKMLVFNAQEADSVTDQITGSATSNGVPIVSLTEQMPQKYDDLLAWMGALVTEFSKAA
jgi:zinc/manganese transport system substrate-binding protein